LSVVASFPEGLGMAPYGGLAPDHQGNLYGTFLSDDDSVVYEVTQ
jgi:hypothetical protein